MAAEPPTQTPSPSPSPNAAPPPAGPTPEAALQFLRSPAAHAQGLPAGSEGPLFVQTLETHMSWVFLAGDRVLKLKKPVRYPFLDFSTLAAREACCRDELRLNARLAPGVYRGLMALLWERGRFVLVPESRRAGRGEVVDWLVWMNRLPADRLLDRAIADGTAEPADVDALADVLSAFYRHAPRPVQSPGAYVAQLQHEQAITRRVLLRPGFGVPGAVLALDRLDHAMLRHQALLLQRVAQGRIVEGHGDLRPEHVCLLRPPVVIDCLEFNAALRQVDPADELAFLALECDRAGAPWIGPRLARRCLAALGDAPPPALLPLYTANRALLRARLALAHLLDPHPRTPERWVPQAQVYVGHAQRALDLLDRLAASPASPISPISANSANSPTGRAAAAAGFSAARPRGFP